MGVGVSIALFVCKRSHEVVKPNFHEYSIGHDDDLISSR